LELSAIGLCLRPAPTGHFRSFDHRVRAQQD
jgi:hypothetical protein